MKCCEIGSHDHCVSLITALGKRACADRCLIPILRALARGGVVTVASCCGHGRRAPEIILANGWTLVVVKPANLSEEADDDLSH